VDREHLLYRCAAVAGNFINSISLRRDGHFMKRSFGGTKYVKIDTTGRGLVVSGQQTHLESGCGAWEYRVHYTNKRTREHYRIGITPRASSAATL
jgi:hypothetical protein